MSFTEFIIRLLAALVAGLLVGLERELKHKNAGLRTNMLVAVGSCVFITTSLEFEHHTGVDITRVLGQVVVGIGFLGAGVIVHNGTDIKGLTTAATVWCCAALGGLAAMGMYKELAVVTVLILAVNFLFGSIDHKL